MTVNHQQSWFAHRLSLIRLPGLWQKTSSISPDVVAQLARFISSFYQWQKDKWLQTGRRKSIYLMPCGEQHVKALEDAFVLHWECRERNGGKRCEKRWFGPEEVYWSGCGENQGRNSVFIFGKPRIIPSQALCVKNTCFSWPLFC